MTVPIKVVEPRNICRKVKYNLFQWYRAPKYDLFGLVLLLPLVVSTTHRVTRIHPVSSCLGNNSITESTPKSQFSHKGTKTQRIHKE